MFKSHRLQSHFPNSPHFSLQQKSGLPKTIETNDGQQNQVLQSPILNCLLTCGIINRVVHANSTKKVHNSAKTHQTLKQPHPHGI